MTISGLILSAVYGAFSVANRTTRRLDAHDERLQNLRSLCNAVRADARVASPGGAEEGAEIVWGERECGFVILLPGSRQAAVRYRLQGDRLLRFYEPLGAVDPEAPESVREAHVRPVAGQVGSIRFEYLADGNWQTRLRRKQWPQAIRLDIRFKDDAGDSSMRQVFRVEAG